MMLADWLGSEVRDSLGRVTLIEFGENSGRAFEEPMAR